MWVDGVWVDRWVGGRGMWLGLELLEGAVKAMPRKGGGACICNDLENLEK